MKNIKIEYIDINKLQEYENNAKIHTDTQIEQIKESIKQFGMSDPIAVWKDNVIIEGHGRLTACKELGFDKVPIIRLEHMTDEQRRAYMIVHNKLTMNTGFDMEKLNVELEELEIDMSDFGFVSVEDFDIDDFFEEAEPKDEVKEEAPKTVKCPHCGELIEVD